MFIRRTRTNNKITGEGYFTFRLVRGERIGGKVRQITVLNLGRHFPLPQEHWPLLCLRIEQLLEPQDSLLAVACPEAIERAAQRYVGQLVARAPAADGSEDAAAADATQAPVPAAARAAPDYQEVDVNSLQQSRPRTVGVEHVALCVLTELGLVEKLMDLGINGVMRAAILGNLIGRMAAPASELATWRWLQANSGLGELLDVDFEGLPHTRLYQAADVLMRHRTALEEHLFGATQALFPEAGETVTLYDLTNTYFEGDAAGNSKARRGHSKEKRSDCPLLTLGLVLDGRGFVRRSQTFAGNVAEGSTLAGMLHGLGATPGAMVIMDAGIATAANLSWLAAGGYRYLVVRRGGARQFDESEAVAMTTAGGETLRLQKTLSADGKEVELHCHSAGREAKETAMVTRACQQFEAGLQQLADGLHKPRCEKRHDPLLKRIGRLQARSRGASQHYQVTVVTDADGKKVTALTWDKSLVPGTMATHPGVYCLRSNELNWDAERMWRTYTMLTDLESVFRSLKGELGLRPVFHSKEERADGHLFITVAQHSRDVLIRTVLSTVSLRLPAARRPALGLAAAGRDSSRQAAGHRQSPRAAAPTTYL